MVPGHLVSVYNFPFILKFTVFCQVISEDSHVCYLMFELSKQTQNMFLFLYVLQTVKSIGFPLGFLPA